jgi:iron complex transport system substrate-binding protein
VRKTTLTVALAAGVLACAPFAQSAEAPRRIVSLNVCADELLLALADPDQIAALSIYAADRTMSFLAADADAIRHDTASAEQVVALQPDIVFGGTLTKRATREILTRLGYQLTLLAPARTVDQSIQQIRQVATLVGHRERGEALVASIDAARARAKAVVAGAKLTAAAYQRRGYVTGSGTLTADLLATVGLIDAGGALTGGSGGFVPLERLVARPPDVLVVGSADPRAEDQGSALLSHPALVRDFPPDKRIVLPDRLTVCGGPSLPTAFDWLASQARRVAAAR